MEMPQPTEAHAKLERLAGEWTGEETMMPSPWAPSGGTATSTTRSRMALGGFYLLVDYEQRVGEVVAFTGHGVYGYDPEAKKYTMHWFDCGSPTSEVPVYGTWEGDTLTFERASPTGGGRYVYRFPESGKYTFEMSSSKDGVRWQPVMEARYTRRR